MAIKIETLGRMGDRLRADFGDPSVAGKEAVLAEWYGQGRFSHEERAEGLGLSRYEAVGVLRRHNVTRDLLSSNWQVCAGVSPHDCRFPHVAAELLRFECRTISLMRCRNATVSGPAALVEGPSNSRLPIWP